MNNFLEKMSNVQEFIFDDIFNFERGKRYKTEDHIPGEIAYISSSKFNNGIDNYVTPPPNMKIYSNKITLNNSGSVGICFYHNYRFVASDHCTIIDIKDSYNKKLNIYLFLFLKPLIQAFKYKYSFAREINNERLKKERISLPIISKDVPDWEFMENYIKNMNIVYNNPNFILTNKRKNNTLLNPEKKFKLFNLDCFFYIKGTKSVTKTEICNYNNGEYPYVTTSSNNNGVEGFYDYHTEEANVITIDSATVGSCFYQDNPFSASDHVEKLVPKIKLNKYIALYLVTIINKEKFKYSFGRKFNQSRIKRTKILLPIDEKENPDWEYMENYIKALPYSSNI